METAQERLDREWIQIKDDRRIRGFDLRSLERRSRDFVPNTYVDNTGPIDPEIPVDPEPEVPTDKPNSFSEKYKETY